MKLNYKSTQNKRGFTYQLSKYGEAFVNYAGQVQFPVVDIGCAYGIATLPVLEAGGEVIAIDVSKQHLAQLLQNVPKNLHKKLYTIEGRFPEFNLTPSSVGAIYISHVLPFLSPQEIEVAMQKLHKWLIPGGKVFMVSFSPFIKLCEAFLPLYEEKKRIGLPWAGFIDNLSKYVENKEFQTNLPNNLNHLDVDDYERMADKFNFHIESLEYFGDPRHLLPKALALDGRERVGAIFVKKQYPVQK